MWEVDICGTHDVWVLDGAIRTTNSNEPLYLRKGLPSEPQRDRVLSLLEPDIGTLRSPIRVSRVPRASAPRSVWELECQFSSM